MNLVAGYMVRFTCRWKSVGIAFDPRIVLATVTTYDRMRVSTVRSLTPQTGVVRDAPGVYHIDIMVSVVGEIVVRFTSAGNGQEGFSEQRFRVVEDSVAEPTPLEVLPAPKNRAAVALATQRGDMIRTLQAAGYAIDESRSDAYIEGAWRELMGTSAREKSRKANEWRPPKKR